MTRGAARRAATGAVLYPAPMGKRGASVHKRERELKKAEKALKKQQRPRETGPVGKGGPAVASSDDLRGYYGPPPEPPPRKGA